jgi:hypothetical protein
VQAQPADTLIKVDTGLLAWKTNDRALASFKHATDIEKNKMNLAKIVNKWIEASSKYDYRCTLFQPVL